MVFLHQCSVLLHLDRAHHNPLQSGPGGVQPSGAAQQQPPQPHLLQRHLQGPGEWDLAEVCSSHRKLRENTCQAPPDPRSRENKGQLP